jgi:hypothetical protein
MFTLCKNFIKVDDSLFLVLRTMKEDHVKNVDAVKEFFGANAVYKRDSIYYFCEKIQELEILN